MGYGRVRASRAVNITPPIPFDTCDVPARVFIYFHGVNERDATIVRLHRPLARHPFYDRFAETLFSPAFTPASCNLINQPVLPVLSGPNILPIPRERWLCRVAYPCTNAKFLFAFCEDNSVPVPAIFLTEEWREYYGKIELERVSWIFSS